MLKIPDVRDVMGYCPRRAADGVWKQCKREKGVAVNKDKRDLRSEECFNTRPEDAEFGICPAGFWSCFGPEFPHHVPFSSFLKILAGFSTFGIIPIYPTSL